MSKRIKKGIFALVVAGMSFQIYRAFQTLASTGQVYDYHSLLSELYVDTGADNLVTAIYLDYRLYDSVFEATILFAVATGIIFMVRRDVEMLDHFQIAPVRWHKRKED